MAVLSFTFLTANFLMLFFKISTSIDTISFSQFIRDGQTLVSREGSFQLGFFSPGSTKQRYLGIWYNTIPVRTVVWVANRDKPINDSSGLLTVNATGIPVLLSQNTTVVWSANSTKEAQKPVLQLLDSGNLVLRDENDVDSGIYLWQSFDHISDTLLPGMKLGRDLRTGLDRRLVAWKSPDDPSPGDLTYGVELYSNPEVVMMKNSREYFRTGPWNGIGFSGSPPLRANPIFQFDFVVNEQEVHYIYQLKNKSVLSRIVLNQTTNVHQRYIWREETQTWEIYSYFPIDYCDRYGLCGTYGYCVITDSPICQCLQGFKPKSAKDWSMMDWSQGCVRNNSLNCSKGDGFIKFERLKLPDSAYSWVNRSMNLEQCRDKCLQNCSCMAYTNSDVRGGGSGCVMWFSDLIDIRQFSDGGQDLYIRMSALDLEANNGHHAKRDVVIIISVVILVAAMVLIGSYYIFKSRGNSEGKAESKVEKEELELPLFDLAVIASATDNFSMNNKLGQGGFGPVYKGIMLDGQEIAVKRLSSSSGQGINELKNEVAVIAKLQHRNLVRLLGCCIEAEEKMLIYEYMPNKSLDSFIFDETGRKLLDWSRRFQIICGIARGLLYLHQDSRLRIIHRDLKASNVLLDHEMNPKISDFGMARTFGGEQIAANTNRVVGTFGYMAPEYASYGLFSIKSDVFSFGILMLEIISGKRNRDFDLPHSSFNLVGRAWRLWREGRPLELIDSFLQESISASEVMRCIHISLLCIEQRREDRPTMSSVVLMLGSQNALPEPKQPGLFLDKNPLEPDCLSGKHELSSHNEMTITLMEAR